MNSQFVIDRKGKKKAVIINYADFQKMQERIADLEDAVDLDKAERNAVGFKDYNEIRRELIKQKKL